jgi:hypothetical protein
MDCRFDPRSDPTKDYVLAIWCFATYDAAMSIYAKKNIKNFNPVFNK